MGHMGLKIAASYGFHGSLQLAIAFLSFYEHTLRCHQTWQAGKSTRNGGFNRKITELNSWLVVWNMFYFSIYWE